MPWDDEQARRQVIRTEESLAALDSLPDHRSAAHAQDAVRALVELYGECLARVVGHLEDWPDAARRLADDELVSHLLLVHDLHPDPPETRVGAVLEETRSALAGQGGGVELLGLDGAVARLRLTEGGGGGCGCSSAGSAEDALRTAVLGRVPEIERVEIETVQPPPPQALIPAESLFRTTPATTRGAT
ncbi:NifU family protein [Streptomyces sp. NPDC048389]|uniref:NifU family protein n=1 Tax=Streptomyces sp. NPDC048389 TaxID=3154622 RepID=UPI0034540064